MKDNYVETSLELFTPDLVCKGKHIEIKLPFFWNYRKVESPLQKAGMSSSQLHHLDNERWIKKRLNCFHVVVGWAWLTVKHSHSCLLAAPQLFLLLISAFYKNENINFLHSISFITKCSHVFCAGSAAHSLVSTQGSSQLPPRKAIPAVSATKILPFAPNIYISSCVLF